ncbi:MAG: homoserine kinase [Propionibacteriales bacterium]|nr:homoserine kinase [Propionibacteriales bacterium]
MSFVSGRVSVRVPGSSANLGPGFDALGLALSLYDDLTAEITDGGLRVDVEGEGADNVSLDENHLVVKAMYAAFDLLGVKPEGLALTCRNAIPHGRGLGSSSAAIVGGIVVARALVQGGKDRLDDQAVYQLATDLEGHPDNVAAALFGGLTIAWIEGAAAAVARRDVTTRVTVFVPPVALKTEVARALIPETVTHRDAAANAGRAALLVAALDGAPEFLFAATEDRLHQSFRASAMPDSYKLLRQLRAEGVPTIISGAGPTVLSFATGLDDWAPTGWETFELDADARGAVVHG